MNEFTITLFEACEYLKRSKKTIGRYVRYGELHPEKIRSVQGTLEYRFSKADLENFKIKHPEMYTIEENLEDRTDTEEKEDRKDETEQIGHIESPPVFPTVIKQDNTDRPDTEEKTETIVPFLMDQIKVKDEQIKILGEQMTEMINRNKETNILMHGLHETFFKLNEGKTDKIGDAGQAGQQDETLYPL